MRIAAAVLLALLATAASAEVISVVRLTPEGQPLFNCGDRCKFRGELPKEPLRLRIIRGTKAQLTAVGNDPRYSPAGCIELYSTIVRPRRSRRTGALLDLKFYFNPGWLAANGRNGQYVFIVERDTVRNGPEVERTSMLRLPAGPQAAAYFGAGIDVTVLAPVNTSGSVRLMRNMPGGPPPAAGDEPVTVELAMTGADGTAPLPDARPHAAARSADCVDLRIDEEAVIFRRADAPAVKRTVRIASVQR